MNEAVPHEMAKCRIQLIALNIIREGVPLPINIDSLVHSGSGATMFMLSTYHFRGCDQVGLNERTHDTSATRVIQLALARRS